MKGWLILSSPDADVNDATSWFASFWEFCECYAKERFGSQWHLSPAQSLLLHAENTVVPSQVIVYSPRGTNNIVTLPFRTSLYDLRETGLPAPADLTIRAGLRLFTAEAALIRVPPTYFAHHPVETQVVLASISDASVILHRLLEGGHSVVAGRLSGAFRRIGRADLAGEILKSMKGAGYNVRETDPFGPGQSFGEARSVATPIVGRLHALWKIYREVIVEWSPDPPGLPKDPQGYLRTVDDLYRRDAYHSLSIEGYAVTPQLIDRVGAGQWDLDSHSTDHRNRDALAARGYWQAFQLVRATISEVITGDNACRAIRSKHRDWYRQLFEPCVNADLMDASMLAGYRNTAVYLRGSRHIPPGWQVVRDAMPAFFHLLERETRPIRPGCARSLALRLYSPFSRR